MMRKIPALGACAAWALVAALCAGCSESGSATSREYSDAAADASAEPLESRGESRAQTAELATEEGGAPTEAGTSQALSAETTIAKPSSATGAADGELVLDTPQADDDPASRIPRALALPDVPQISLGKDVTKSPLEGMPGYVPPNDPESDAVRTGRRMVAEHDVPFRGGFDSVDLLGQAIVEALNAGDRAALNGFRITQEEFERILWPEFPQSRPVTRIPVREAWFFLDRRCHGGISKALSLWENRGLEYTGYSFTEGVARYMNFDAYQGFVIHVRTSGGEEKGVTSAHTVMERHGVWKVYAYED